MTDAGGLGRGEVEGKNMWVGLSSLAFLLWSLEIQKLLSRAEEGGNDMNIFVP